MQYPFPFDQIRNLGAVMRFIDTLDVETDRGCALMTAAYLDEELKRLILAEFVDDAKVADKLISVDRPLGTFSSRIDLSYMLGLIGKNVRRDAHLIRKIRNTFGHTSKPLSFADPPIANRCREFHYKLVAEGRSMRGVFTGVAMCVLAVIHHRVHVAQHFQPAPDVEITEELQQMHRDLARRLQDHAKEEGT